MDIEPNPNPVMIEEEAEIRPAKEQAADAQGPPQLENFEQLTPLEKITHTNPKCRAHFYTTLLDEIERENAVKDSELANYLRTNGDMLMAETVVENQRLVLRLCFKIEQLPLLEECAIDLTKKSFWYNFLDKYLSSTKSVVKDESWRLFELLARRMDKQTFVSLCLEFLSKSNVKINKIILNIFNAKFDSLAVWSSFLPQISQTVDKLVLSPNPELRNGSITLIKHLAFLFSIDVTKSMKNLKPAQLEDIRAFLISKGPSSSNSGFDKAVSSESARPVQKAIDLFKISEPVCITSKFNDYWAEKVLSAHKWSEKKEMMEALITGLDVPRLQNDNYSHLIGLSKRLIADNNMQVQMCGIKVFGLLAKGLRHAARNYVRPNMALLISKLKDKKSSILDCLHAAIANCFYCLSIDDLYEEVKMYNTQRNKDIRLNVLQMTRNLFKFLVEQDSAANADSKILQNFIKTFGELLNVYYEDSDIEVRRLTNDVVQEIHDLWKNLSYWDSLLKVINPSKIKVKEKSEKSNNLPTAPSMMVERNDAELSSAKDAKVLTSKLTKSYEKRAKNHVMKFNSKEVIFYIFKPQEILEEEAVANMRDAFGEDFIEKLLGSSAKEKAEVMQSLSQVIKSMDSIKMDQRFVASICTLMRRELKDFKESNILLVKQVFDIFETLLGKLDNVEDLFAHFSILMVRKLLEAKFKTYIQSSMRVYKQKLPFHKMIHICLYNNDFFSNPKLLAEIITLCLEYFDADSTYIFNDLQKLMLPGLNSSNQATRTAAVAFLKALVPNIAPQQAKELIKGIENPNLSKQVIQEIQPLIAEQELKLAAINPFQAGPSDDISNSKPRPEVKRNASLDPSPEEKQDGGQRRLSNDISRKINNSSLQDIIAHLNKPDWKIRKEAVECYVKYLESNTSLFSASNINETFQNLNLRLQDSSRPVAISTLIGLRSLLDTYFLQLKPFHRMLVNTFLENLSDKNVSQLGAHSERSH